MKRSVFIFLLFVASLGMAQEEEDQLEPMDAKEMKHLERCLQLAEQALKAGDQPFGSVLVDENNRVLASSRNRVNEKNPMAHPELELAYWAAEELTPEQRKNSVMYTSGEHCPMCATAHGWVGLGKIVYIHSAEQLGEWLREWNVPPAPVNFYPIQKLVPRVEVVGPVPELLEAIKELHRQYYSKEEE